MEALFFLRTLYMRCVLVFDPWPCTITNRLVPGPCCMYNIKVHVLFNITRHSCYVLVRLLPSDGSISREQANRSGETLPNCWFHDTLSKNTFMKSDVISKLLYWEKLEWILFHVAVSTNRYVAFTCHCLSVIVTDLDTTLAIHVALSATWLTLAIAPLMPVKWRM